MRRRIWVYGVLAFGLAFLLLPTGFLLPFELILIPCFGWVPFLWRTAQRVRVSWDGVGLALICVAGVVALGQAIGGWLAREFAPGGRWPVRWTLSGLAAVVLLFGLGIAAAGVVHQVGWLLTTPDRLLGYAGGYQAAKRAQSVNNLKQIGLALMNYAEVHGSLPPAATVEADGRLGQGWPAQITPFLERNDREPPIRLDRPWDDPINAAAIRLQRLIFQSPGPLGERPDALDPAPGHYAGNAWVLGGTRAWRLAEITDGTSNTIVVGEAAGNFRPWADPHSWRDPKLGINRHPEGFGAPWVGGANFLFADGSVRFLKNWTAQPTFEALCTPSGGEQIAADQY